MEISDLPDIADAGAITKVIRFGTPWHGRVETLDKVDYWLHTGKQDADGNDVIIPWPAVQNADQGYTYYPRFRFVNPFAPVAELSAEEAASEAQQGREWWNYAVIVGKTNKLWGRIELGANYWLYAAPDGGVWKVTAAFTEASKAGNNATLRVTLTEFGRLVMTDDTAQTHVHDVAVSDIGLAGMTEGSGVPTLYLGDHTQDGGKTLLMVGLTSTLFGDSRAFIGGILELELGAPNSSPVVSLLKSRSDMGSYTSTRTVLQDVDNSAGACVDSTLEAELNEGGDRMFHASYAPDGAVDYWVFEKWHYSYGYARLNYNCSGVPDTFSRIAIFDTTCKIKKNGSPVFAWSNRREAVWDGSQTVTTWTTSLPYRQGVDYTANCDTANSNTIAWDQSSIDSNEMWFAMVRYSDGYRTSDPSKTVSFAHHFARMFALNLENFIDRDIFNADCSASYTPDRPADAKPDDTYAIICIATPDDIDTALHETTIPAFISITHDQDERIHVADSVNPVCFI